MIRRPPRSTLSSSSAASDVYKRQVSTQSTGRRACGMVQNTLAPPDEFVLLSADDLPDAHPEPTPDITVCSLCRANLAGWCVTALRCGCCQAHVCENCAPHFVAMPHLIDAPLATACNRCYEEQLVLGTLAESSRSCSRSDAQGPSLTMTCVSTGRPKPRLVRDPRKSKLRSLRQGQRKG
eukprot:TRINITY_DN2381_c0_g1_i6.p1 TRINITY_DN2381_c0_g1~~TRINITY_DN2381_c0_g1_i6.p1  ORF type:complete len:180 (+),score=22.49 TRINITY_DN2381_c0_g1_i6:112-651(+)